MRKRNSLRCIPALLHEVIYSTSHLIAQFRSVATSHLSSFLSYPYSHPQQFLNLNRTPSLSVARQKCLGYKSKEH